MCSRTWLPSFTHSYFPPFEHFGALVKFPMKRLNRKAFRTLSKSKFTLTWLKFGWNSQNGDFQWNKFFELNVLSIFSVCVYRLRAHAARASVHYVQQPKKTTSVIIGGGKSSRSWTSSWLRSKFSSHYCCQQNSELLEDDSVFVIPTFKLSSASRLSFEAIL